MGKGKYLKIIKIKLKRRKRVILTGESTLQWAAVNNTLGAIKEPVQKWDPELWSEAIQLKS